jgi:ribosome-associated protein
MSRVTFPSLQRAGDLKVEFYRASGPGGQNVNKVSTAVRLRLDIGRSNVLSDEVKRRLRVLAAGRLTAGGVLIIEAQRYRTQDRNRKDAVERMMALIQRAEQRPKPRRPTKPTAKSRERRLEAKKRRGVEKRSRGSRGDRDG